MSLLRRIFVPLAVPLALLGCNRGDVGHSTSAQSTGPAVVTGGATLGGGGGVVTTGSAATSGGLGGSSSGDGTDAGGLTGTGTGDDPPEHCAEIVENAAKKLPADILLVIDNSGSMKVEAASVKANMNQFSAKIIASGVDVHVVLLSALGGANGMCIDPPLGGGGCPFADTKLPTFLHIEHGVGSNDALEKLLQYHDDWKDQMRPEARKHVVVVSDDNSDLGAEDFDAAFRALDPGHEGYRFHAIVGQNDKTDPMWCTSEPVCCDLTAAAGEVYLDLIKKTGGVYGDLCKQDFTLVFDALSTEVILNSGLACEWQIPEPMGDQLIDYDAVHVEFDDGMGAVLPIDRVAGPAACQGPQDGWYFDAPQQPGKLLVCPQTCNKMQLAPKGSMSITFGCKPIRPQ